MAGQPLNATSADGSDCELLVIPRHEERMLAQHCRRVLANLENTS